MSIQYDQQPPWRREFLEKRQRAKEMERQRETEIQANLPSWKKEILERKSKQKNSLVYFGTNKNNSSFNHDDNQCPISPKINGHVNNINHTHSEKEEHLLPLNQNPWVKSDPRIKHSNHLVEDCNLITNNIINNDSVFDESNETNEVQYGAGFVTKLLRKFSNMSTSRDISNGNQLSKRSMSTDSLDDRKNISSSPRRRAKSDKLDVVVDSIINVESESHISVVQQTPPKSVSVDSISSLVSSPSVVRVGNKDYIPENERPKKNIVRSRLTKFQTENVLTDSSPSQITKPVIHNKKPTIIPNGHMPSSSEKPYSYSDNNVSTINKSNNKNIVDQNDNIPNLIKTNNNDNTDILKSQETTNSLYISEINPVKLQTNIPAKESSEKEKIVHQNISKVTNSVIVNKNSKVEKKTIDNNSHENVQNNRLDRSKLILDLPKPNYKQSSSSKPGKFSFGAASNVVQNNTNKQAIHSHLTRYTDVKESDQPRSIKDYKDSIDPEEYDSLIADIDSLQEDDDIPITNIDDIISYGQQRRSSLIIFIGENVKLDRNLLVKTKNSKSLKISFSDNHEVYEYPCEASVWHVESTPLHKIDISPDTENSPIIKSFINNPALTGASASFSNYKSTIHVDYEFGQHLNKNDKQIKVSKKTVEDDENVKPVDHSWSETSNSDLLF